LIHDFPRTLQYSQILSGTENNNNNSNSGSNGSASLDFGKEEQKEVNHQLLGSMDEKSEKEERANLLTS
jgi:hypothetical protein